MTRVLALLMALVCIATTGRTQEDSATNKGSDTVRIGNITIIRDARDRDKSFYDTTEKRFKVRVKNKNVNTYFLYVDFGFSQINDKTNYPQSIANGYLGAGANEDWFNQLNFKSTNVNIWLFSQKFNMVKHVVNLRYAVGLELNNYKYTENIKFNSTNQPLVIMDQPDFRKVKLAADYLTVPLMLDFNFTPGKHRFGFSAGISAGYLYSSRYKTVGGGMGKKKEHDNYDLRDFKISYVGEISLGPVRFFGSYATQSMFKNALDQTPFNFGIRLSEYSLSIDEIRSSY